VALSIGTRTKAFAYATALRLAIGSEPVMEEAADHIRIRFTPEQKKRLQAFIESQMKKGPGDVRVEIAPVLMPILFKRLLPLSAAAVAALFVIRKVPKMRPA